MICDVVQKTWKYFIAVSMKPSPQPWETTINGHKCTGHCILGKVLLLKGSPAFNDCPSTDELCNLEQVVEPF